MVFGQGSCFLGPRNLLCEKEMMAVNYVLTYVLLRLLHLYKEYCSSYTVASISDMADSKILQLEAERHKVFGTRYCNSRVPSIFEFQFGHLNYYLFRLLLFKRKSYWSFEIQFGHLHTINYISFFHISYPHLLLRADNISAIFLEKRAAKIEVIKRDEFLFSFMKK